MPILQLQPGTDLLHYRIVDKLGEGGMGVVWRATDTTLGREVAIKVLPEAMVLDPDRLGRFEREARLLASLSHPNIAEIFGLHEADGVRFIAMELVDGEDLSQILKRGPLPESEVLEIARGIASALEVAHEQGIVHRDLKPANLVIGPDGRVKVLDFGLAKAYETDPAVAGAHPSMSPTLTSARTMEGMILGTAAYMAPEQARGQAADKRADVWALGCVLFEALSGQMAFPGETVSDTLAAVLKLDPEWQALPSNLDPRLRLLITRCLEKDVRQRLRDVGEARIGFEGLLSGDTVPSMVGWAPPETSEEPKVAEERTSRFSKLAVLALVAMLFGALGWWLRPLPEVPEPVLRRLDLTASGLELRASRAPALSPDGRRVAYIAEGRVWVRDLANRDPVDFAGSEGAENLAWSPDSEHLAWEQNNKVWRAEVGGASPSVVCEVSTSIFAIAWGPNDRLLLTPDEGPLYEVPARGGDPRPLLEPVKGQDDDFHQAAFLPADRGLVFATHRVDQSTSDTIEVLVDGERQVVLQIEGVGLSRPRISADGHLIYSRSGSNEGLWGAPISLESFELTSEPVLIDPGGWAASVSDEGSLLYVPGSEDYELELVWVDREGRIGDSIGEPQENMTWPSISPDGRFIAVTAGPDRGLDIWVYDSERGSRSRLTFDEEDEWAPAWGPKGERVAYGFGWGMQTRIFGVSRDGRSSPVELATGNLVDFTPDGEQIVFERASEETDDDLFVASATGEGEPSLFLGTDLGEEHAQVSPDGRFVAYVSEESGRDEVYLRPFPEGVGRWQISIEGGGWPRWNPAAGELFYLEGSRLMSVEIDLEEAPLIGTPRELFSLGRNASLSTFGRAYDVDPSGDRFVMVRRLSDAKEPKLSFVRGWTRLLR